MKYAAGMGDVRREGWGRDVVKVIRNKTIEEMGAMGGDDIVVERERERVLEGRRKSEGIGAADEDIFAGMDFGSAVKGSPASVTSEDGDEMESSLEMFEDYLGGGGIMRGDGWGVYKDGFAMRKVRKRNKNGKIYYKKAKLEEGEGGEWDEGEEEEGEEKKKGNNVFFRDIKAEGRKDGIKVVLDGEGNVKVNMKEVEDLGIEDVEYDSDGEILEEW